MTTMKWVVLLSVLSVMVMGASLGGPGLWGAAVLTVVLLVFQRRVKVLEAENLHQEADVGGWARACRTIQDQRDKAQTEAQRWFNLLCACRAKAEGRAEIVLSEAEAMSAEVAVSGLRAKYDMLRRERYDLDRAMELRAKANDILRADLAETERIRDNGSKFLCDMVLKYNALLRRRRVKKSKVRR